jgi:hypothetical protein
MEQNNDTITVYWSTPIYNPKQESWSMIYSEPTPLFSDLRKERSPEASNKSSVFHCPAMADTFDNLFVVKQAVENTVSFQKDDLIKAEEAVRTGEHPAGYGMFNDSKLNMWAIRPSSFDNNINIMFNQGWMFYASEPLIAEFTAPYFPPISPAPGARIAPGKFDVGQWYRPYMLDYHLPLDTKKLEFKEGDPLYYIKFHTTKKVVLKRYVFTEELEHLQKEHVGAPARYGRFMPLAKRYELAKQAKVREQILYHIKQNCVD